MTKNLWRKLVPLSTLFILLLSSCNQDSLSNSSLSDSLNSDSISGESSEITSNTSADEESILPSISELPPAEYEDSLDGDGWVDGYLYIHYLRSDPLTYDDYFVWAWQKVPSDNEGQQFNWSGYDQAGAYVAINLESADFLGSTKVGFLIVTKESLTKSAGMWESDSGGDVYLSNINENVRPNGTVHVFTTEGRSAEPSYIYSDEEVNNPYADPSDSSMESKNNINSSAPSLYRVPPTSPDFLNEAGVGYQIQVASFADSNEDGLGDIRGIINKLDYISDLNVDVIWLTPVQDCESYHGYDTINFFQVDARFGSLEDYRELIQVAHSKGIRVLMDLVVNHTSKNHLWFKASASLAMGTDINGNQIDYRNFYHWKYSLTPLQAPWYRYATTNYYYYGKFGSSMPELNYDYQGTRDAMLDVAKFWLGFGLDGFRIDAVKHIYMKDEVETVSGDVLKDDIDPSTGVDYSTNQTKNLHFFREFSAKLKALYPNTFIVGENFDGWDAKIAPYYQGMDSQFDFAAYYHFVNNTFYQSGENKANVEATDKVSNKYNMFNTERNDRAINSGFTSNHDVERMLNHVNNDRTGIGATVSEQHTAITASNAPNALEKARLYAATLILQPGLTFIYYGDELGMSGNIVPNNAENAPELAIGEDYHLDRWYRQPMKWDSNDSDPANTAYTFSGYQVAWDDYNRNALKGVDLQEGDNNSLLNFFQDLTAIKSNSAYYETFIRGNYAGIYNGNENVFSFSLTYETHVARVYINFGLASATPSGATGTILYSYKNANLSSLPGQSILVTYQ
ncbi:MAG: alpha-amylase family glycosyl hydrolase [Bacilli bacterium]|jgi:glycosidase